VGYHAYLQHGTSVCWQIKSQLESRPVTADLTTTILHRYKLLINDIKPVHLCNHSLFAGSVNNQFHKFVCTL